MSVSGLNAFSNRFAEFLFAAHPEWRALACIDTTAGVAPGSLLVTIQSPLEDPKRSLIITADNQEVTVCYDYFHQHFNMWADDVECDAFREALEFIHDLLDEKVAIQVDFKAGAWAGSTLLSAGDPPEIKEGLATRIRSWKGTYDREWGG